MKEIMLYVDGACHPNPGIGGWGAVLLYGIHRKELSGAVDQSTNQRMEIIAAIEGLKALKEPCKVSLWSDSQYLINGATGLWNVSSNLDLWAHLDLMKEPHEIEWNWCKGHNGTTMNELADRLANSAITAHKIKMRRILT